MVVKLSGNYLSVALFLSSEGRRGYFVSNKKYTNKVHSIVDLLVYRKSITMW